ncbi:hypothetical protein MSI_08960 [Treponema sp. JC4]|uniref:hypothetical protein n=1 Tax=Treponema sp. JC4 TaxID=1124982 RepID=UPI00025AFBA8|nr:hypothetical protein [Treponema sp. JC4]EID85641.1 hypothetical protein MSI_08960 [Treponema sp. JC4]
MRACKRFLAVLAALFTVFAAFSQANGAGDNSNSQTGSGTSLQMPSMPDMPRRPSMPSVSASASTPSITMPSVPVSPGGSGSFYIPSFQSPAGAEKSSTAGDTSKTENKTSAQKSEVEAKTNLASALKNELLTAGDISALYDSGLFGNLSSLAGAKNISGASASGDAASLSILEKILASLEELKEAQKALSPEQKQELANYQLDAQTFKKREPKILRFKINGYNINDSVTKAFFSDSESDGTFMLTGDRTYYVNHQARSETFYILFKAISSNGSAVIYDVRPSLVQDYENQNSFIYRFAAMKELRAEKTGNLVALHSSDGSMNVDLLLDIDGDK